MMIPLASCGSAGEAVSIFHLRFVGAVELPKSLSQMDVDESFRLSQKDIADVRQGFKGARLGAALQLVFVRATGRSLDKVTGIPRTLLKSLCTSLGLNETTIASLKTLYQRPATRFAHQKWAREASGLSPADDSVLRKLAEALAQLATTAASVGDLVKEGERWLFDRKHLLPGDRVIRDAAREAFAANEAAALVAVRSEIPARVLRKAIDAMFSKRLGRAGGTILEWLRGPPGKHGRNSLTEVTQKLAYLKRLRVDTWHLSGISNARLRAYSQSVVSRPPFDTQRLSDDKKAVEIACFLRTTLLELTDSTIYMAGRRVCDFVRHAGGRVQAKQARSTTQLREEREQVRTLLYAEGQTAEQTVQALKVLIPPEVDLAATSRAALVRQALTEDNQRITALLNSLAHLDVKGDELQRPLKQIEALRDFEKRGIKELPQDFDVSIVDPVWRDLLSVPDRKKALAALRASTLTSVRRGLRGGRLWIDHSWSHRNREDLLIPKEEWKENRQRLISALSLTSDPKKYLDRVHGALTEGLHALSCALAAGRIELDSKGHVRLPAIQAMEIDAEANRSRDAMFSIIGETQFGDMIVELDAHAGISELLLGSRAKTSRELTAVYAALLAHGTENDARGVAAMIPGMEVSHISAAMRSLEAHGRLRRANERLVAFQRQHPIADLWCKGDKASADMMSLDASRHLYNARLEPRRRTPAVGIYTHIMGSYGVFYDQPIVLNERQTAAAVHGVEDHNAKGIDSIRLSLLAVDTHGYTNVGMAIAKLLGFDLCVRLQNLAERMLYLPRSFARPENLERLATGSVSEKSIISGWDDLLRLIASIRGGHLSAKEALEKLGSAASGDPLHKAAEELGKMLRTIFLCDYFTNEEFRREIHTLLNRGESVHQLQRAIYHGRVAAERGRRGDEMKAISGSHALLTNIVVAWNTMKMQGVVDRWRKEKHPIEDAWLRRMGPVHFWHINFRGTIAFKIEQFEDALLHRASVERRARAA
jgi:TnpA family transposase